MIRTTLLVLTLALVFSACAPVPTREEPTPPPTAPDAETAPAGSEPAAEAAGEAEPPPPEEAPEPAPAEPEVVAEAESQASEPTESSARAGQDEPEQPTKKAEPAAPGKTPAKAEAEAEPAPAPEPEPVRQEAAVTGRITLNGGDADPEDAVIYFVTDAPPAESPASVAGETREIVTRDKNLSPTVMAIGRGTEIRFPNEDPILHNLFSVSPANDFDLGVYGPGEAPSVTFEQPGVVNIYCNVHHDMHAHVLVVDTPWRTRAAADGSFRLEGLPPGPGELHVWHRQSEPWSRALELPAGGPVEVSLAVTKPRLPPHRDKTGQPYNRRDRDPYR